jgi:hypothetical protein
MTEPSTIQAPPNTGPRPLTMEDVFKIMGQYVLEIEALRREVASLREQLAERR